MKNTENQLITSEEMIVNIGSDRTEVLVRFNGKVVASKNCSAGIIEFKESIDDYMRRKHNMTVDDATAERMLEQIGAAIGDLENPPADCEVTGTDLVTEESMTLKVSSREMAEALDPAISEIERRIIRVLVTTPVGYSYELYDKGFEITGNVSFLRGLDKRFSKLTALNVRMAEGEERKECEEE